MSPSCMKNETHWRSIILKFPIMYGLFQLYFISELYSVVGKQRYTCSIPLFLCYPNIYIFDMQRMFHEVKHVYYEEEGKDQSFYFSLFQVKILSNSAVLYRVCVSLCAMFTLGCIAQYVARKEPQSNLLTDYAGLYTSCISYFNYLIWRDNN